MVDIVVYSEKKLFKKWKFSKKDKKKHYPARRYVVQFYKWGGIKETLRVPMVAICSRPNDKFIFTNMVHDGYTYKRNDIVIEDWDVISYKCVSPTQKGLMKG